MGGASQPFAQSCEYLQCPHFLSLGRHIGADGIISSEALSPEGLQQPPEPSSFPLCPISNTICQFICLEHYLSYIATMPYSIRSIYCYYVRYSKHSQMLRGNLG